MKQNIVQFIYSMKLRYELEDAEVNGNVYCGFIGSSFRYPTPILINSFTDSLTHSLTHSIVYSGNIFQPNNCSCNMLNASNKYVTGHLAMTYTALATLITLGEDINNLNKQEIINNLRQCQQPDGSFSPIPIEGCETDVRYIYCAVAISSMLNDFSGINIERTTEFISNCLTYEGGFGLIPGAEAQGGATYCSLASLSLLNRMNSLSTNDINNITNWCLHRQVNGYQGRTNKEPDSCYSFWVGGSLSILNSFHLTDVGNVSPFILQKCQAIKYGGGFSKHPDSYPDVLHTFYSIAWLSLASKCDDGIDDTNLKILKKFNALLGTAELP